MSEPVVAPIDPTTMTPVSPAPIPPVATVSIIPENPKPPISATSKKSPWPIVLSLLFVIALALAGYFYWQNMQLKSQITTPTPSSSPTTSTDPTANWLTYTHPTQKYQFKYPPDWSVAVNKNAKANVLFGMNADSEKGDGGVEVRELTIDPKKYLDMTITEIIEQKQFTTKNGYEGYSTIYKSALSGINFVFKHSDGLIYNIYLNANSPGEVDTTTFDQILSTFKFTDSATAQFTMAKISQACIDMQGSSKYWDAKYQECNESGTTKVQLESFCTKYSGTFVSNGDTCRHAQAEGQPCGPEATYYCSLAN